MADNVIRNSSAGQYNSAIVAGANGETLAYTGAGLLCKLSLVTIGTVAVSIYDGTQSTGGTLIYTSLTNPTTPLVNVEMPFSTGIVVKGTSTASHGVVANYDKTGTNGV